ncbi:helix-turn-helix transcriptional regulator [Pontibacter sp. JH31]|uniref:Helix-turn-helix transcriptional regulator n=1 Tax=Pontibacter aquaedesilientis TaxID=2766980 RepID=A0ABR7XKK2_9BACT|nr:helix-turn-helix transcriptional regulator [Pontibacter aquaedesilientis]MBD1398805.1 helix-turn-helix transcriptional regulator [Pontibacter aquaedesilientis]
MKKIRFNRISIVLDEFDLDQKDLAELIGVSKDTVSRWCRNVHQPKLQDLYHIAKALRIDIRRLIEPTSWENEKGLSLVEKFRLNKKQ